MFYFRILGSDDAVFFQVSAFFHESDVFKVRVGLIRKHQNSYHCFNFFSEKQLKWNLFSTFTRIRSEALGSKQKTEPKYHKSGNNGKWRPEIHVYLYGFSMIYLPGMFYLPCSKFQ